MKNRDIRLVSGRGQFVDDLAFADMAHLAFVGSPYPHAKIVNINAGKALQMPGVLTVITGKEILEHTNPLPVQADLKIPGGSGVWSKSMPWPWTRFGGLESRWPPLLRKMKRRR